MKASKSTRAFFQTYTKDFTKEDLGKLFTYETPEAYRFFARGINTAELEGLPRHRRALKYLQGFFLAFTMRLSPARRVIYGLALVASVIGILNLFQGFGLISRPDAVPAELRADRRARARSFRKARRGS